MFLGQAEDLGADELDDVIEMNLEDTLEEAVQRAVDGCVRALGVTPPSKEKIAEAVQAAKDYAPTLKKADEKKKSFKPRYFGLLPELNIHNVLASHLTSEGAPATGKAFWEKLVSRDRVTRRPHVTVVHQKSLPEEENIWNLCMALHRTPLPPHFRFKLGHVVWNERVMAVTVEDIQIASTSEQSGPEGSELISTLPLEVKNRLHITVGTRDGKVMPVEAKALVEAWRKGDSEEKLESLNLQGEVGTGQIKGLFN